MKKEYVIVMADMVGSSEVPQPATQKIFAKIVANINQKFQPKIISPLTITLGDEFQGIVKSFASGLEIIIALEEAIAFENFPFKLRYVVNKGKIETKINTEICHGMIGEGLSQTRSLLEKVKKKKERYLMNNATKQETYNGIGKILDMFLRKWEVKKEGEILSLFLSGMNYREIAKKVKKSESQIWKKELSLEIETYKSFKKLINQTIYGNI